MTDKTIEQLWKDPDWTCPNQWCRFVNSAIRQKCRNCGHDSNAGEFPYYDPMSPYEELPEELLCLDLTDANKRITDQQTESNGLRVELGGQIAALKRERDEARETLAAQIEETRCMTVDRDSWRKAAREHNIERIKAQSELVRTRETLRKVQAGAVLAREAAVLIERVSPSASITVKESDYLDCAGAKLRELSAILALLSAPPAQPQKENQ